MEVSVQNACEILQRTPATLNHLLDGLSDVWVRKNDGGDSWSPYGIVGHLIHGDKADWIPRMKIILECGESRKFEPFDRFAQLRESEGKTLADLLYTFEDLRRRNLDILAELDITPEKSELRGRHPDFGSVTLGQLLSTWVVHDLGHVAQIARVMAAQYRSEVGPWKAFLPVLGD